MLKKQLAFRSLKLFYNVINEVEERVLLQWIDPLMRRRRYEGRQTHRPPPSSLTSLKSAFHPLICIGNHWDDVISQYKEVDTGNYRRSQEVAEVLEKVSSFILTEMEKPHEESTSMISPHLIDLAPEGYIGKTWVTTVETICSSSLHSSVA
eukprot:scaffold1636_cov165-Ochromonas_danica.AAC.7